MWVYAEKVEAKFSHVLGTKVGGNDCSALPRTLKLVCSNWFSLNFVTKYLETASKLHFSQLLHFGTAQNCKKWQKLQNWKLTLGHLPLCLPTKKYIKPPPKNDESGPKRQKQPKTAQKHKNANFSKFPRCPNFKFFVVFREVICQKLALILDPVNFLWVFILFRWVCVELFLKKIHIVSNHMWIWSAHPLSSSRYQSL